MVWNLFRRSMPVVVEPKREPPPTRPNRSNGRRAIRSASMFQAGTTDRFTGGMDSFPRHPDLVSMNELRALIARSREQYAKNDYAKAFVRLCKTNIVGPNGVRLQSQAKDPNGTPDTLARRAIEDAWKEWSKPKNADMAGERSFRALCDMAIASAAMNGEILAVMVVGKEAGPWGFSLQLIDPVRLDLGLIRDEMPGGGFIRFGIEYDRYGRKVAYYFLSPSESMQMVATLGREPMIAYDGTTVMLGKTYQRVPAEFVVHAFIPEVLGQKRGWPWMATSLLRMANVGGYEDAALIAARVGAAKMGFFRPGENADEDSLPEDPQIPTDASPGTYDVLPRGWEFDRYDPTYPAGEFGPFMKATLRGIASGLGVSYNSLANDLEGVSYSSLRQGALDERDCWKVLQAWFIESFIQPIHDAWLPRALLMGRITVAGASLKPSRIDKYSAVGWQPRRWAWIDPQKEVSAAILAVDARLRARGDVIRESGDDPDDTWDEMAEEEARLKELGIAPLADVVKQASAMAQEAAADQTGDAGSDDSNKKKSKPKTKGNPDA